LIPASAIGPHFARRLALRPSLFPPPALGERCHRGLARRLVAVARRARYTAGGGGGGFGGAPAAA